LQLVVQGPVGPEFSDLMRCVVETLKASQRPICSRDLAKMCGYPSGGSCVKLRRDVELLNEVHDMPIRSTSRGFIWCRSPSQMRHYANSLQHRANEISARAKRAYRIADSLSVELQSEE